MGQLERGKENKRDKRVDVAGDKASADGWRGFVNVELTANQKLAARETIQDPDDLWDVLWDLVGAAYKLTISYDVLNTCYTCSLTCKANTDTNHGLTLSGRGGSVMGAVAAMVYKHRVVLEGDWTVIDVRGRAAMDENDLG